MTTKMVVSKARIARATFYELFDSSAGAARFACQLASRRILEAVDAKTAAATTDDERLQVAIAALAEFAASEPALTELSLVHRAALVEGDKGPQDREVAEKLTQLIQAATDSEDASSPANPKAELLAHATLAVIASRVTLREPFVPAVLAAELYEIVQTSLKTMQGSS